MKKLYFLCSLAFMNFTSKAAIIIVSNNPNIPGQYSNLQTAIDAAAPDDTIYVQGSTTSYGDVAITKKLNIIGSGMMPDNTSHLGTTLGEIRYRVSADGTSSPSGSTITGCNIYILYLCISNMYSVSNISIYRNRISSISGSGYNSVSSYAGIHIYNNIVGTLYIDLLGGNSVVNNNIIINGVQSTGYIDRGNWVLANNFIGERIAGCYNATIVNNIIYSSSSSFNNNSSNRYCNFTKNHFYSYNNYQFSGNFLNNPSENNTFNTTYENILNQNPSFVKYTISDPMYSYSMSNPPSGPFVDFHLNNDSPGKNYGTDGTDIGIYGGTTPFVEGATTDSRFRYFPMPAMPQMLDLTITNPSIPSNSSLNVNFSAEKKN
jgi:hypothetical protein